MPFQVLDRGGYLPEGLSMVMNGTGAPEHVPGPGAAGHEGPLVVFQDSTFEDATDIDLVSKRMAFELRRLGI